MITYKISRSVIALLTFTMLFSLVQNSAKGQQNAQWPFYIAFEDATGAKDTIWMVFDTSAVAGSTLSPHLGEVPQIVEDSSLFRVWTRLQYGPNEFNTTANNISNTSIEAMIYAANYEFPIIARWDSSLFSADVLYEYGDRVNRAYFDNEYFFMEHNSWSHEFELLLDDHVEMPDFWWGSGNHFPLFVGIERGSEIPISVDKIKAPEFSVFPNPATTNILLSFPKAINADLRIYNANGMLVKTDEVVGDQKRIDLRSMAAGLYFVEIKDGDRSYVKKVVVNK